MPDKKGTTREDFSPVAVVCMIEDDPNQVPHDEWLRILLAACQRVSDLEKEQDALKTKLERIRDWMEELAEEVEDKIRIVDKTYQEYKNGA